MTFNVVVVDDEDISDLIGNIDSTVAKFDHIEPGDFESDIAKITNKYDLILMDQKLAGNIAQAPYMGTTMVQELRTRMAERQLAPKPIILWSIANNIDSYRHEKSSHNLVDAVWKKEWLHASETEKIGLCALRVTSLINGYERLKMLLADTRKPNEDERYNLVSGIFGIEVPLVQAFVPDPVTNHFINKNNHVEHHLSNFLINSILRFNGFLIDECTVAARLGIDRLSNEWQDFKCQHLSKVCYKGVYADFYARWWASELENWWLDNISDCHPAGLEAGERVELINSKFGLCLDVLKPAENHRETKFWHCCVIDGVALDETDSFKVTSSERREWQDQFYASFNAINRKGHRDMGLELGSRDKERFKNSRKMRFDG